MPLAQRSIRHAGAGIGESSTTAESHHFCVQAGAAVLELAGDDVHWWPGHSQGVRDDRQSGRHEQQRCPQPSFCGYRYGQWHARTVPRRICHTFHRAVFRVGGASGCPRPQQVIHIGTPTEPFWSFADVQTCAGVLGIRGANLSRPMIGRRLSAENRCFLAYFRRRGCVSVLDVDAVATVWAGALRRWNCAMSCPGGATTISFLSMGSGLSEIHLFGGGRFPRFGVRLRDCALSRAIGVVGIVAWWRRGDLGTSRGVRS